MSCICQHKNVFQNESPLAKCGTLICTSYMKTGSCWNLNMSVFPVLQGNLQIHQVHVGQDGQVNVGTLLHLLVWQCLCVSALIFWFVLRIRCLGQCTVPVSQLTSKRDSRSNRAETQQKSVWKFSSFHTRTHAHTHTHFFTAPPYVVFPWGAQPRFHEVHELFIFFILISVKFVLVLSFLLLIV